MSLHAFMQAQLAITQQALLGSVSLKRKVCMEHNRIP